MLTLDRIARHLIGEAKTLQDRDHDGLSMGFQGVCQVALPTVGQWRP